MQVSIFHIGIHLRTWINKIEAPNPKLPAFALTLLPNWLHYTPYGLKGL